MTFDDLLGGEHVFLDANTFVYHFLSDPTYGTACTNFMTKVHHGTLVGSTATHILSEVVHRTMTLEAMRMFGWSQSAIGKKLRQNPAHIRSLTIFKKVLSDIGNFKVNILQIPPIWIDHATQISDSYGLLSNDALTVAAMEAHGITALASNDSDFDRVPSIQRYQPL